MVVQKIFDEDILARDVERIFGDDIREEVRMLLGDPDTLLVEVPPELRDCPGMYYVHPVGNENFALSGLEEDATDDKRGVTQALMTQNKVDPGLLIYNTPVIVRWRNGMYEITDLDGRSANEYLDGLKERPQRSIDVSQMDYGLLRPSDPKSMRAIVSSARYFIDEAYFVPSLLTVDFTSEVPGGTGLAVAVKIELQPSTNTLLYTYSSSFANNDQHYVVFSNYPKTLSAEDRFFIGWIKLYSGMTEIQISDILPGQEFLNKFVTSPSVLFPKLVTAGGRIVVAGDEPVWID